LRRVSHDPAPQSEGSCASATKAQALSAEKRADTVGHSIPTQHGYCSCVGLSIFLGLQRQHMQGTIFGMWGMTNSIRALTLHVEEARW
jgi:hypothetical protein